MCMAQVHAGLEIRKYTYSMVVQMHAVSENKTCITQMQASEHRSENTQTYAEQKDTGLV